MAERGRGGRRARGTYLSQLLLEMLTAATSAGTDVVLQNVVDVLLLEAAAWIASWRELEEWLIDSFEAAWGLYFKSLAPPDVRGKVLVMPAIIDSYLQENLGRVREELGLGVVTSGEELNRMLATIRNRILYAALRSFFEKLGLVK